MTPSLRFMRQRTCLTRTLTRNPYLIGCTRHICHTRTLTCDPYQIGSNPARHSCPTGTLTHVLVQIRTVMGHIVTRGPSPTTPSSGQSMGQRMPGLAPERRRTRNNGRAHHSRDIPHPQDEQRTHTHYTPPTSTKHNQSHCQFHSIQHKSSRDTKPHQKGHTQPNHCQTDLSTKNKVFSHKTTTNRRRNIPSISRTKLPPSANKTNPTNPRQYDRQTNSPGLQRHPK